MPFSALNVPLPAVQSYLVRTAPPANRLGYPSPLSQRQRETGEFDGAAHGLVQNTPLRPGLLIASLDATLYEARVACRVARFDKQRFGPRRCIVGGLLDRQVIAAD